jgi:hypothetical protein
VYDKPKTVLQQKLRETLDTETSQVVSDLIKLSLLKVAEKDEDLVIYSEMFKLLGVEMFTELINLIDGQTLSFPGKDEFKDIVTTVLCYYYKVVANKEWDEIKALLGDPDLNTIKFGIRSASLGSFLDTIARKLNAAR